jgi:hypothetical protein
MSTRTEENFGFKLIPLKILPEGLVSKYIRFAVTRVLHGFMGIFLRSVLLLCELRLADKRVFTAYCLHVEIYSNSSISAFQFNTTRKQISFNTTGPSGTKGFCDVTIPDDLLWGEFLLFIDGSLLAEGVNYTRSHSGSHYFFNITYSHSTHTVEIIATEAIPEFPSIVISLLTMIVTLLAIIAYKRKRWESHNTRALNRF